MDFILLAECFVEGPNVYVIMELLTGGDLLENLTDMGVYREQEALLIFR
jgi:serine/threonine protein kinase